MFGVQLIFLVIFLFNVFGYSFFWLTFGEIFFSSRPLDGVRDPEGTPQS